MQSTSQMLLLCCQQRLHLPGLLRLRNAWAAADSGSGTAGIAQEFRDGHYVMAPQATPAVGLQGSGPEHAGDNAKERGPGQPTTGKVEGKQVGPGRINRVFTFGQHRHEILIGQNDRWRQVKLRIIIGYQDIQGPSGAEVLRRAA